MKRNRFTVEQIIRMLREAEVSLSKSQCGAKGGRSEEFVKWKVRGMPGGGRLMPQISLGGP